MKRFITYGALLLLMISAPGVFAGEFFVGAGLAVSETPTYNPPGSDPLFLLRIGYQMPLYQKWNVAIEAQHQCSLLDGQPINNRPDHRQQNSLGVFVYRTFRIR